MAFPLPTLLPTIEELLQEVQWLDGLSRQLEMGEFQAFWRDAGGGGDAKPAFDVLALTGLASAVRSFIMGLVNVTYQKISAAALGEMLQLEGAELDAQISASQYERDGDLLVVPLCAENQEKPKSAPERKIAPTWAQHGLTSFGPWRARPTPLGT